MLNSDHERLLWVDKLCDRFESAWGTEKQFSIETVLQNVSPEKTETAIKALMALEQDFRAGTESPLTKEESLRRFPEHSSVVDFVFQNLSIRDSLRSDDEPSGARSEDASTGLRIPQQMGRYRIIRKLGQGAMGSVFLAHDEPLDRQVALKIPRGDVQRDSELRIRFEREARAVAALDHPNICRIYDIGEFEGIHFICMGYIDGFTLARFTIAESELSEQRIAVLILKLAKALAAAHEAGFIHRDLKPANVMVDANDEPIILDFGLARRVIPSKDTRITQTGAYVGSPAYMSPEQIDGDQEKIGVQTDVYSLGVLLYELLTGRLPFEGSMASVIGQIMTKDPDQPSEYRHDLSVRLENICLRMMARQPEKRHPSMHAVSAALQEYLDRFGTQPVTPSPVEPKPIEDVGSKRRQIIEGLIKSADYAQAEKLMVALSKETSDSLLEAAAWAASELPILRKTREEVRAGRQDIYNTANRLMKSYDYEQAGRLLEEYPFDLRTPKMQELLERAEEMTRKVESLRRKVRDESTRGDNKALLATLNTLLEVKPSDRRAKELRERLLRREAGPITKVLGTRTPSFVERMSAGVQVSLLVMACAAACAYPAYRWASDFLSADNGNEPTTAGNSSETSGDPDHQRDSESPTDSGPAINVNPNATPDNDDSEWVDLLAGDFESTWESYSGGDISSLWILNDGVLSLSNPGNAKGAENRTIATRTSYADFELEFEWKIGADSDCGVLYLVETGLPRSYMSGPEYQMIDEQSPKFTTSPETVSGAIYGVAAVTDGKAKPAGQWNGARIVKSGRMLAHWLNGAKVAEMELDSAEWQEAISAHPRIRKWPRFGKSNSGSIALQNITGDVMFRTMRLRELNVDTSED